MRFIEAAQHLQVGVAQGPTHSSQTLYHTKSYTREVSYIYNLFLGVVSKQSKKQRCKWAFTPLPTVLGRIISKQLLSRHTGIHNSLEESGSVKAMAGSGKAMAGLLIIHLKANW